MKRFLLAGAAALALTTAALVAPAFADTFHADSFSQPGTTRAVSVTLGTLTETVSVGEINLHRNIPAADLLVWCLDLNDLLYTPYDFQVHSYTAGDVRPGMAVLDGSQLRQIASLMLRGLTLNSDLDLNAAVQLAIWRTEYGNAFSSNASGNLLTLENLLLADTQVGGSLDCPGCTLTVLTDAVQQPNQALGFAIDAVPGPVVGAGMPGVLAGAITLWGLAAKRRRRRDLA